VRKLLAARARAVTHLWLKLVTPKPDCSEAPELQAIRS